MQHKHWIGLGRQAAAQKASVGNLKLATVGLVVVFRHGENAADHGFPFDFTSQYRRAGNFGSGISGLGRGPHLGQQANGDSGGQVYTLNG